MTLADSPSHKKILMITSSGGGGHLLAARGKTLELLAEYPETLIIQKDILQDFLTKPIGLWLANRWNQAQKKGNIKLLDWYAKSLLVMDQLIWIPVFLQMLHLLRTHDFDRIIDTQPLGTSATITAMRFMTKYKQKKTLLEKILIELPTPHITHFLGPIKKLKQRELSFLKLITGEPIVGDQEKNLQFWHTHFGLNPSLVSYQTFPLRPKFLKLQKNLPSPSNSVNLPLRLYFKNERELLAQASNTQIKQQQTHFLMKLLPSECIITLMLGSQPAQKSTLQYVQCFLDLAKRGCLHNPTYLFVFSGHHENQKSGLLNKIAYLAKQSHQKNLKIIPLSFQEDTVIAPLYARSNLIITRSGGMTSMELLSVAQGQICIHTEGDPVLLEKGNSNINVIGMPKWEAGNALYLKKNRGAQIVTPQTITSIVTHLL